MKKTLLPYILSVALLSVVSSLGVVAQNVQLHYDFGRSLYSSEQANRQHVTITLRQTNWVLGSILLILTSVIMDPVVPIPKSAVSLIWVNSLPLLPTLSLMED